MRVFVNIITNAVKYTPEGGSVKVRCEQLGKAVNGIAKYKYTVSDNGIGMSEEFQKHMFEEFSREQNTTASRIQGTGLGLTLVKKLVEMMDGTITCKSRQGEGSCFTVTVPLRVQDGGNVKVSGTEELEDSNREDFTGRRVLLVEDNELNRELANEILSDAGLIVEEAENGSVAVEVMHDAGPFYYDFILMDIQMPVMDGYEAARRIRAIYPDENIPIIALSANAFEEDRKKSIEAGMNDHVAKPINVKELFAVLAKYL